MTLPLVFDAPRRALPPRHLADLAPADRRAAVAELGLPGYRADQLARALLRPAHRRPGRDDRPAGGRPRAAGAALLPPLVTPVLEQALRRRRHPQDALARARRHPASRVVLMGYPDRATVCVSSQAGCGMACPFCATGQGGLTAQPVHRGDRRAGRGGRGGRPRRRARRARRGCPTWSSWAWASRWPTTTGWSTPSAGSPSRRRTGWASPRASVTVSTVGLVPAIDRLTAEGLPVTLAVSPAHPGRRAARHPGAGEQPLEGRRGARRGAPLRAGHRAPGVDRVRADPGRQRPALAGRPAREGCCASSSGPSGCTST